MSIIGPRPALWNQDELIAERDKYGVNNFLPGLTGYAQVHGRDELPIPVKAELDGYYVKHYGFTIDFKIFLKLLHRFLRKMALSRVELEQLKRKSEDKKG